jgi:hypothetical protein
MLGYSFPQALRAICKGAPQAIVVAIGISDGISELEELRDLERLTGGRFRPVGFVHDPDILELYYSAADVYLDCIPCTSLTSVLDAARHGLPVQTLNNAYLPIVSCDDLALDSVLTGASNQTDYVAGAVQLLQWPEGKRAELGGRLRAAVLQEHCGASWKKKWLDPALDALNSLDPTPTQPARDRDDREADRLVGLAGLGWTSRPASMFIADAIVSISEVALRIRVSCLWRSIWPWLFDSANDGMARKRFRLFRDTVKTVLPNAVSRVVAKLLHPILKRL